MNKVQRLFRKCCEEGLLDEINELIQIPYLANYQNDENETGLMWASENVEIAIIDVLIKNGADIDTQDRNGETALFYALHTNAKNTVKCLLNHGADPCIEDFCKQTFIYAAAKDRYRQIFLLLDNIDHQNSDGNTALAVACQNNDAERVIFLYENNADFHIKNKDGQSPLDILMSTKDQRLISLKEKLLLEQDIENCL